jgi:uncharacterized protein (TIGR02271 family)
MKEVALMEQRSDRFTGIEDQYQGYTVYDRQGEKIGKVDDLFVDENDQPEYIGVKMGLLGTRSTLLPWQLANVDENDRRIDVSVDKDHAKEGPAFDDDEDITPDYEQRVYSHYGLQREQSDGERGGYGEYHSDDLEDELRVQRSEEELRAGTREREAGALNVRKRVRTDREQVRVPVKHEEVSVERVPVNEEASGAEIGDDEVVIPVVEEEIVTEKRAVVKEELRIRKDVVEDEEVVEEDVRKEEVDIDDQTTTRRGR